MVKQAQTFDLRHWSARTHTRVGLPVVIAVLFSIAAAQLWTSNNDAYETTEAEQHGVAYLKPLTQLMDRVVTAQSSSVRGEKIDSAAIRDAMSQVDAADRANGSQLAANQRWEIIRGKLNELMTQRPTGEAAYRNYTDTVQLIDDLVRRVADTSSLILEPVLDAYYLMDTAVLRLPNVLQFAGRASDLATLGTALGSGSQQQVDTRISAVRYQVSLDGEEVASGVRKALDSTTSTTLGPNITNQLDAFRTAVDAFVPPVNLLQTLEPADAAIVVANADRVRQTAKDLMQAVLKELDGLLGTRANAQSVRRSQALGLGILCLLLTGLLIWTLVTRPENPAAASTRRDGASVDLNKRSQSDAGSGRAGPGAADEDEHSELVHSGRGRGLRARRRERADDAR